MKNSFFLLQALVLAISFGSNATGNMSFDCSDRSYAYNYSSLVDKGDSYEFGIKGASFAQLSFPYQNIIFDGYHERAGIYFKFAKSECQERDNTIICHASIEPLAPDNPLYIERKIRNLESITEAMTPIFVRLFAIEFNSETKMLNMSVNTDMANPLNEHYTQNTSIQMEDCNAHADTFRAPFPPALNEYLKRQ